MPLSAAELIERVTAVYRTCSTYRDTGDCTTVFIKGPRPTDRRTTGLEFRTAFVRPDRYRFEFARREVGPRSEWSRYVVWQNRHQIRTWWSLRDEVREFADLSFAISGPTGVSSGTAYNVPSLLFPVGGNPILHPEATVGSDEDLDGVRCHKLVQSLRHVEATETIWISSETFLILRMDQERTVDAEQRHKQHEEHMAELRRRAEYDDQAARILASRERRPETPGAMRTERTIRYYPALDVDIDDEEFAFEPPGVSEP